MRIGIDARLWNESGVGRYTRNLVKELQKIDKDNEYTLFVLKKDYEGIKYHVASSKYKNWKLVEANIRWHSIEEQFKFLSILNKENLDLVHFPYFSVPIFYNKPFVVTIHDLIINHFPTGQASTLPLPLYKFKLLGYKFVLKQAVRKSKKIITVSNATKEEIIEHFNIDKDKIAVTYEGTNGISNIKFPISNFKLKNKNYFLYVGNAYPHKNLEQLIQAYSLISSNLTRIDSNRFEENSRNSGIKLLLVGKEDYFYKRLKTKVKELGLESSIIFYGETSDAKLVQLYKNAKALIMPSLMEGFGLPVLEAMVNKCLVLCSDIPALRELTQGCAIYFNPNSVQELVEKMKEVQFNDVHHYTEKIEKGFERSKEFSWEKMSQLTLKIYSQIAQM